jgi:hypothetical protein
MFIFVRNSFFCIIALIVFSTCKNDLKITAPYKEIPSVFAIITPQEPIQMIRINKVFLGQGNANVMAKVVDSVNYQPGDLTVMLERFVNGSKTYAAYNGNKTEVYFHDSIIQTVEGAFATTQRVYVSSDKLYSSGDYKLTITNNHTKNVFTATTTAMDSVPLTGLPPFAAPFSPVAYNPSNPPSYYVDYSNVTTSNPYIVRTKPSSGGFLHDLTIRVRYYDSINVAPYKIDNTLEYVFNPQQLSALQPFSTGNYFNFNFTGSDLFYEYGNILATRTDPPGFVGRKAYRVDFICYAATQDYYNFLQFAAPSLSFSQQKILYSNFDNKAALGLFTFRTRCLIKKDMSTTFISEFAYNVNTCRFRFFRSDLGLPGCQ